MDIINTPLTGAERPHRPGYWHLSTDFYPGDRCNVCGMHLLHWEFAKRKAEFDRQLYALFQQANAGIDRLRRELDAEQLKWMSEVIRLREELVARRARR